MTRVIVVGAGISGLTLAYRLQESLPGADIRVLEQNYRPGGTIDTIVRDGFVIEAGPNGFPDNNPSTLDLVSALGLNDRLLAASEAASRNRFLLLEGRLRLLPSSFLSFLSTDLLSSFAKLQVLAERFRPPRRAGGDESIDAFARRRVGGELARTFVDAFVTGILAGDPRLLSIQAAFPKLAAYERDHGSVFRGLAAARKDRTRDPSSRRSGKMYSFTGGLRTLVDVLTDKLRQKPLYGVGVRRVRRQGGNWCVDAEGQDHWIADAVVLCCPAWRQAELLVDVDTPLAETIAAIPYNRVAVVALGYRRADVPHSLEGFGYLSPQRTRRDVLGVQWCSSIYADRAPGGTVLLRAICGGWNRAEMVDWPDDRLLAAVRAELAQALGVRVEPLFHHIVRWPRAIPQYHLGHLARVAWIESRLSAHPGLYLGGNAYRGVAINDCVEQAGLLAARVRNDLARP